MPVTQGNSAIQDMSAQLSEQLRSTGSARGTLGDKTHAFDWAGGSIPRGVWSFSNTASVDGPSFSSITIKPSATPPAVVAPGAAKPDAVVLESNTDALVKYAGSATLRSEDIWYSDALAGAVVAVIVNGSLMALEAACLAKLSADAGLTQAGDSWPAAVLGAIGQVAGQGGRPDLLVISAADFAVAVETPSQLQFAGADAIPTFLGLSLHLSPKAAAGTAYVLDSSAFTVAESSQSPSVSSVLVPATNEALIAADVMAVAVANAPGLIAKVTPVLVP